MNSGEIGARVAPHCTEDCVYYASVSGGGDVVGKDAARAAVEELVARRKPHYRRDGDVIEHGNFLVFFMTVEEDALRRRCDPRRSLLSSGVASNMSTLRSTSKVTVRDR